MMRKDFYEEEYIIKNPTLSSEDVETKFNNLLAVVEGEYPRFLDIGCGSGELTKRMSLVLRSDFIVGIDVSSNVIRKAREITPSNIYVRADAAYLPFKGRSFDITFTADLLEHVPSPKCILDEAGRVADLLMVSVPLESGIFSDFVFFLLGAIKRPTNREIYGHIHRFTKKDLDGLLMDADFIRVNKKVLRTSYTRYTTFFGRLYSLLFNLVYQIARPIHQGLFGGYTYLALCTRRVCPACSSYKKREIERFVSATFGPLRHYVVARCTVCGLDCVVPMPKERENRRMYEGKYHETVGVDYTSDEDKERRVAEEKEKLWLIESFVQPGNVLDVGPGFGTFLEVAGEMGWSAVGVELNSEIVRHLRSSKNLDVIQGTLRESRLEESSFDVVNLDNVIEHTIDPKEMLLEVKKVLKDGGVMLVQVPNTDWIVYRVMRTYYQVRVLMRAVEPLHHLYFFNRNSLMHLIEGCGFRTEAIFTRKSTQPREFKGLRGNLYRGLVVLSSPLEKDILVVVARKPEDEKHETCGNTGR